MLCKDKITAIFCIIDDILKEIYPVEDKRRKISDSKEICCQMEYTLKVILYIFANQLNDVI